MSSPGPSPRRSPRTALLTGATGFIGSSLAVELLQQDRERIFCVVRPNGDVRERLESAVTAAAEAAGVLDQVRDRLDRLVPVDGDIMAEGLGLTDDGRAMLRSEHVDECWHSAASLRYEDRHKEEILGTNVDGTRHLLDAVADVGVAEVNHISTAYVAGVRTGEVHEEAYDPTFEPNNWYEVSKRQGEDLVIERSGDLDRVRIMRPSIVVGNMSTYRSTSSSGYYGFLRGLAKFCRLVEAETAGYLDNNRVQLFLEPQSSLNLVPIDLLVAEAVGLADDPDEAGCYFHLTNPFPVTLERARVGPESSIDRLRLDLIEDRAELRELDAMLDDALDFYRPYLRNDKQFVRSRDGENPPEAMYISDEALAALSVRHFDDTIDLTDITVIDHGELRAR